MKESEQAAHQLRVAADKPDGMLPQIQCKKCGYSGCRPYAEAMAARQASPDLCAPGGNRTRDMLAQEINWQNNKLKDIPVNNHIVCAQIDESRCVGCYKCIEACPVDAIIGAHGMLHTVIESQCTGCGLCVEPCPVDCIAIIRASSPCGDGKLVQSGVTNNPEAKKRLPGYEYVTMPNSNGRCCAQRYVQEKS